MLTSTPQHFLISATLHSFPATLWSKGATLHSIPAILRPICATLPQLKKGELLNSPLHYLFDSFVICFVTLFLETSAKSIPSSVSGLTVGFLYSSWLLCVLLFMVFLLFLLLMKHHLLLIIYT